MNRLILARKQSAKLWRQFSANVNLVPGLWHRSSAGVVRYSLCRGEWRQNLGNARSKIHVYTAPSYGNRINAIISSFNESSGCSHSCLNETWETRVKKKRFYLLNNSPETLKSWITSLSIQRRKRQDKACQAVWVLRFEQSDSLV